MTVINELSTKGVLLQQANTRLLGVDMNGDKVIQDQEVIPDFNQNGTQDLNDILSFIVNNVRQMPIIQQVRATLANNTDEAPEVQAAIKTNWLPRIININSELQIVEAFQLLDSWHELNLRKEKAVQDLDSTRVTAINASQAELLTMIKATGLFLIDDNLEAGILKDGSAYSIKGSNVVTLQFPAPEYPYDCYVNGKRIGLSDALYMSPQDGQTIERYVFDVESASVELVLNPSSRAQNDIKKIKSLTFDYLGHLERMDVSENDSDVSGVSW